MTKYKILQASDNLIIERMVNDALENGWQLEGGINVFITEIGSKRHALYSQAMTKNNAR